MRAPSLKTIIPISTAVLSGALLIWTAQSVQTNEQDLQSLKAAIQSEKETIRVLETEWDYLNQPQRLETLSHKYLDLSPIDTRKIDIDGQSLPSYKMPATPLRKPAYSPSSRASLKPLPELTPLSPQLISAKPSSNGGTP